MHVVEIISKIPNITRVFSYKMFTLPSRNVSLFVMPNMTSSFNLLKLTPTNMSFRMLQIGSHTSKQIQKRIVRHNCNQRMLNNLYVCLACRNTIDSKDCAWNFSNYFFNARY